MAVNSTLFNTRKHVNIRITGRHVLRTNLLCMRITDACKTETWSVYGPVTLCNFLSNLSRNTIARQVDGELHSVTCVVSQSFLLREALHKVELSSTFRNGLQQLTRPLHSVSPFQQLVSQFYGRFNTSCFAFREALRDKLLRKLHSITGPGSTPNLGNLQR